MANERDFCPHCVVLLVLAPTCRAFLLVYCMFHASVCRTLKVLDQLQMHAPYDFAKRSVAVSLARC